MDHQELGAGRIPRSSVPKLGRQVADRIEALMSTTEFPSPNDLRFGSLSGAQVMLAHAVKALRATLDMGAGDRLSILTLAETALHGVVISTLYAESVRRQARVIYHLLVSVRDVISDLILLEEKIGSAETAESLMEASDDREAVVQWRNARLHCDGVMSFLTPE
jgi:hypothetical protein